MNLRCLRSRVITLYACSTLFSQAIMSIAAGVLCLLFFIEWKQGTIHLSVIRTPAHKRLLFVTALMIISIMISAAAYGLTSTGTEPSYFPFGKCAYFFWPFVLACYQQNEDLNDIQTRWLQWATCLGGLGIIQFLTGFPRENPIPQFQGFFHATLFLGHHLSVASILIFPLGVIAYRWKETKSWKHGIALGLIALTLVLTFSRTLWLALFVVSIFFIVKELRRRERMMLLALLGISSVIVFLSPLKLRIFSTIGTADRYRLWEAYWHFFTHNPWFGIGLRNSEILLPQYFSMNFEQAENLFLGHAHNLFLENLSALGILGFSVWLFWLRTVNIVFKGAQPIIRSAWNLILPLFLINGLTQVNFWESKVLHTFMLFLSWAIAAKLPQSQTHPNHGLS